MELEPFVTGHAENRQRYLETEMFRHFHDGPFGRCPDCGRMVFLPCLACRTEKVGTVADPAEIKVDNEKAIAWIKNGAQPTDTVRSILKKSGAIQ